MTGASILCAADPRSAFVPLLQRLPGAFALTFTSDVTALQDELLHERFDVFCADWALLQHSEETTLNAALERGGDKAMILAEFPTTVPATTSERVFAVLPPGCGGDELEAVCLAAAFRSRGPSERSR